MHKHTRQLRGIYRNPPYSTSNVALLGLLAFSLHPFPSSCLRKPCSNRRIRQPWRRQRALVTMALLMRPLLLDARRSRGKVSLMFPHDRRCLFPHLVAKYSSPSPQATQSQERGVSIARGAKSSVKRRGRVVEIVSRRISTASIPSPWPRGGRSMLPCRSLLSPSHPRPCSR
jgi:hypothetical protein